MSYPAYTRAERIADGAIHVIGVSAALIAIALLIHGVMGRVTSGTLTATLVYSVCLLAMLGASAAYHLAAHTRLRPMLRRLDHAAIYLKIAGTVTPLAVLLGTAFGYAVLTLVWAMAILGALSKLRMKPGRMTTGWWPYMALGWVGLVFFIPLTQVLPTYSLIAMGLGGALYCAGVVFYAAERLRFANAIWHAFILVATGCFYSGIASALTVAG